MNRAEFLKAAGLAVAGAYLWSSHSEHGSDEVSLAVRQQLDIEATKIQSRITVLENPKGSKGEKYLWNFAAISKAICYLSYLKGGFDQVDRVVQYLLERGFRIDVVPSIGPLGLAGTYTPPLSPDTQGVLALDQSLIDLYVKQNGATVDQKIFHELYHLIQDGNDHELMEKIIYGRSGVVLALGAAGGVVAGRKVARAMLDSSETQERRVQGLSRRSVLAGIAGVTTGLVSARVAIGALAFVDALVDPLEVSAYVSTGAPSEDPENLVRGTLTSNPLIRSLEGKLLIRNTK